ncbi:MAG: glutathione S-transferase family protein [Alphaproteobacteria bacterium]|nr:glutathione S-transferase family protein [Alphaproteobacteria bacterium]
MYALYYYPDNASTFIHMLLRELGVAFELRLVDRKAEAQHSAEYLRLNPLGQIPVLIDGDLVLTETAAIALHLLDRHPECGLAPALGTQERAHFYKWMMYLTNTLQSEHLKRAYPHRHVSDPAAVADVRATALRRLDGMFDYIEVELGQGPFLLGEHVSAADFFLLMLVMWGARMARPPMSLPAIGAHAARMLARPAVAATLAAEGGASF